MSDEPAVVSELREARESGSAKPKAAGRRERSLLSSPPPAAGADRGELVGWATAQLGLGGDPITAIERYGRHLDARLVAVLASGQRVTFERQADAFDPRLLVRTVIAATGATLPHYNAGDAQVIATVIVRAGETLAEDDARGEAAEWGRSFLDAASSNTITASDFANPAGRWEALSLLTQWRPPVDLPPFTPAAERSVIVLDGTTGARMVRTSDFAAHVRGLLGRPVGWAALHGRMVEVGWEHRGEVQQRQPGGQGKIKARVYAIAAGWEHS